MRLSQKESQFKQLEEGGIQGEKSLGTLILYVNVSHSNEFGFRI